MLLLESGVYDFWMKVSILMSNLKNTNVGTAEDYAFIILSNKRLIDVYYLLLLGSLISAVIFLFEKLVSSIN